MVDGIAHAGTQGLAVYVYIDGTCPRYGGSLSG